MTGLGRGSLVDLTLFATPPYEQAVEMSSFQGYSSLATVHYAVKNFTLTELHLHSSDFKMVMETAEREFHG